jgi:hypothetical protein
MGERRRYPRVKLKVPAEMRSETASGPWRAVAEEISLYGCYIATTLDIGTEVDLTLCLNDKKIHTAAAVATRYPQVGNGFEFINWTPENRLKLSEYILRCQQESTNSASDRYRWRL